jgi:hemerythrin-like domain-containing protein
MDDHRLIEKVLDALDARLAPVDGAAFPAQFVEQALDFLANFADGCHHYREEEALFPALAARGVPVEGGPIGMMLFEHGIGRKCIAGMRENLSAASGGDAEAQARLRNDAAEYTRLLREHIWKEDNILFRMARQALDAVASQELAARFLSEDNPRVRPEVQARYAAFARSL